jgi:muconolactone D-isomerase
MEFLVEFELVVPAGTPQSEIDERERGESAATTQLANEGHLLRVWSTTFSKTGGPTVIGLYRAESPSELEDLLRRLPLYEWMRVGITALGTHPNDPLTAGSTT